MYFLLLLLPLLSTAVPDILFLFLEFLLTISETELSTCAAGVGCRIRLALDSPVLKGTVVVRLSDRLLGDRDA